MSISTQSPTHYISLDDVKVLKEALAWHEERYIYINDCINNVMGSFREGAVFETQSLVPKLLSEKNFHTRIAEALRRVVG